MVRGNTRVGIRVGVGVRDRDDATGRPRDMGWGQRHRCR